MLPTDFYLIGQVEYDRAMTLQRRLAYEASDIHFPRIVVLLCEHSNLITVGRDGSRGHVHRTNEQLARTSVQMRWVSRGGGCIPHQPGQLAIYPVVPLRLVGWSAGEYLRRLQAGMRAAIHHFNVRSFVRSDGFDIYGQHGVLAACGVAVRQETTSHGFFINVNPSMQLYHHVDTGMARPLGRVARAEGAPSVDAAGQRAMTDRLTMTSLLAERRVAVTMTGVRAAVIDCLASAFGSPTTQVHASQPGLRSATRMAGESRGKF